MVLAACGRLDIYSRRQSAAEDEREPTEAGRSGSKMVAAFGGDQLTILGFNAAEGEVPAGGRVVLCYGVSNAAQVKIEPEVEPIKPALSHCLNVFPKKTTTYTLRRKMQGEHKSASLTMRVR